MFSRQIEYFVLLLAASRFKEGGQVAERGKSCGINKCIYTSLDVRNVESRENIRVLLAHDDFFFY